MTLGSVRIKTLELKNFKAFHGEHTLELGGKNLLLLGENGSGKTSLVRALEAVLEGSRGRGKFEPNIFAPGADGYVRVTLNDRAGTRLELRSNGSAAPMPAPLLLADAAKAKRVLDYKGLLRTYFLTSAADSEPINLFELLMDYVLADFEFGSSGRTFKQECDRLADLCSRKLSGAKAAIRDDEITTFNNLLDGNLTPIVGKANELLRKFDGDLSFELPFTGLSHQSGGWNAPTRQMLRRELGGRSAWLNVTFQGQSLIGSGVQYHDLLNEARLSAIALSLYFAALSLMPQAGLRLLVLDDVLIGLDMGHRLPILHILETEFSEYQIVMLTYDPVWFLEVQMRVSTSTWKTEKVYRPSGVAAQAFIVEWGDLIRTARRHLANDDYGAAANYARAAFEQKMKNYCEKMRVPVGFQKNVSAISGDTFYRAIQTHDQSSTVLSTDLRRRMEAVRKVILNPLSHDVFQTISRQEVEEGITVVVEFCAALQHALDAVSLRRKGSLPTPP